MTIKELREYCSICGELEHIDILLKGKRIHVKDSVQSSATYPYNLHNVSVEGDVYESSSARLLAKKRELENKKTQIELFINEIKDDRVRRAIEILCIEPVGADLKKPKYSIALNNTQNVPDIEDTEIDDNIKSVFSDFVQYYNKKKSGQDASKEFQDMLSMFRKIITELYYQSNEEEKIKIKSVIEKLHNL